MGALSLSLVAGLELSLGVESPLRRRGEIGLLLSGAGGERQREHDCGERTESTHLRKSLERLSNGRSLLRHAST